MVHLAYVSLRPPAFILILIISKFVLNVVRRHNAASLRYMISIIIQLYAKAAETRKIQPKYETSYPKSLFLSKIISGVCLRPHKKSAGLGRSRPNPVLVHVSTWPWLPDSSPYTYSTHTLLGFRPIIPRPSSPPPPNARFDRDGFVPNDETADQTGRAPQGAGQPLPLPPAPPRYLRHLIQNMVVTRQIRKLAAANSGNSLSKPRIRHRRTRWDDLEESKPRKFAAGGLGEQFKVDSKL